ncbi:DUF1127 domain-containing protein [Amaricoccus macauensis]|uniref:DUF1127 domain-containing protein n=1 Tax=Amaricoccus macauensis TaxID=57001 RepID=UPI003C7B3867
MTTTSLLRAPLRLQPVMALADRTMTGLLALDSRYREARSLARLEDRLLRDIGITRGRADAEARRLKKFIE